ncbi:hypothetical protein NA57DRAFT_57608 [Rhizodiscina lignyota]|uniref:Uncharacterized protein n=1 Tax=Rhizodiscina lignyota TaxID=1504668 RepID=A0A9P4ICT5_9PEZI|nr:hypothetical protein NA57DRAFT_57608 [Rhizodiscina lignyota]
MKAIAISALTALVPSALASPLILAAKPYSGIILPDCRLDGAETVDGSVSCPEGTLCMPFEMGGNATRTGCIVDLKCAGPNDDSCPQGYECMNNPRGVCKVLDPEGHKPSFGHGISRANERIDCYGVCGPQNHRFLTTNSWQSAKRPDDVDDETASDGHREDSLLDKRSPKSKAKEMKAKPRFWTDGLTTHYFDPRHASKSPPLQGQDLIPRIKCAGSSTLEDVRKCPQGYQCGHSGHCEKDGPLDKRAQRDVRTTSVNKDAYHAERRDADNAVLALMLTLHDNTVAPSSTSPSSILSTRSAMHNARAVSAQNGTSTIGSPASISSKPQPGPTMHVLSTSQDIETIGGTLFWRQRLPADFTYTNSKPSPPLPLYTITVRNEKPQDTEEGGGHAEMCNWAKSCWAPLQCVAPIGWRTDDRFRYGWCRNLTEYPNVDRQDIIGYEPPEKDSTSTA